MTIEYGWIFGLSIMLSMALLANYFLKGNQKTFMVLLVVMNALVVWVDLLELWTLILSVIFTIIVFAIDIKKRSNIEG